jgi:outer membrane lipoprotein-sorting protein
VLKEVAEVSVFTSRPVLRWLVPATVAAAVIGGGAAVRALQAAAAPTPPPRSAAELLADIGSARLDAMSGTVVETADLGLPNLPMLSGLPGGDLTALLSGTHTVRLWYSGPDSARIALLSTLGEYDLITNGHDLWTWSSSANTATHRTLSSAPGKQLTSPHPSLPGLASLTPQQLAAAALKAVDPSTLVTTGGPTTVAGRTAYELVLAPRDAASLIAQVRIAIDAEHHVPLRLQVLAHGSTKPSLEVAFTQISFTRPGNEHFQFTPPPGAVVTEAKTDPAGSGTDAGKVGTDAGRVPGGKGPISGDQGRGGDGYAVLGSGWTTVVVARVPVPSGGSSTPDGGSDPLGGLTRILDRLPTVHGSWGSGHVLTGTLFSLLVTDDGRVFLGPVTADRLYQAAADPAAVLPSGSTGEKSGK